MLVTAVTSHPSLTPAVQGDLPYVPGHRHLREQGYPNLPEYVLPALTPAQVHAPVFPGILHEGGSQPLQPHEVCALNEFPCMVHVFLALPWLWEMGMSRVDYARSK